MPNSMADLVLLNMLMEFVGILSESRKLLFKNKKMMFFVMIFPLLLTSIVYLLSFFSMKYVLANLILESGFLPSTNPNSIEFAGLLMSISRDIRLFVSSLYIFSFFYSIITLFFSISTVHASAVTYREKNININDLMILITKSLKQPLVTYFYIILFTLGYQFLFLTALLPVFLYPWSPSSLLLRILALGVVFSAFQSYLAIVWNLSLVISILEETYGIQALGKAAKISKGTKLHMFLVNLLVVVLGTILVNALRYIDKSRPRAVNVTIGLVAVNSICLVKMIQLVIYTVLYHRCKSIHGEEEVELQGKVTYTKLPAVLLLGDNDP